MELFRDEVLGYGEDGEDQVSFSEAEEMLLDTEEVELRTFGAASSSSGSALAMADMAAIGEQPAARRVRFLAKPDEVCAVLISRGHNDGTSLVAYTCID